MIKDFFYITAEVDEKANKEIEFVAVNELNFQENEKFEKKNNEGEV